MESSEEDETLQDFLEDAGHGDSGSDSGDKPGQWTRDSSAEDLNNHCHDPHVDQVGAGLQVDIQDSVGNEGLKEQLANVEAMVQEMKVSFTAALEQLSIIQEGGDNTSNSTTNSSNNNAAAWHKMDSRCQRQDQQMSDLAKSIDNLRKEVGVLSVSVHQVVSAQQSLQDQVKAMQSGQQLLLQELVSAGLLSAERSREVLNKCQLSPQGKFPVIASHYRSQSVAKVSTEATQGFQDQDKAAVTAAACKSLSLTQALASHCQDIDVTDSSEEDIVTSSCNSRQQRVDHQGQPICHNIATEKSERRQRVQDIVDSEQEYCSQLWTVLHSYQQPLQDGHYMSSRQLCLLFPSPLADLYQLHAHILQSLQDRLAQASFTIAVGDVFAHLTDTNSNLLGLYQEYVESLPGAISCLRRQMSQSRSFRTFVKEQRDSSPNNDLLTLLISPLQRIPKYMLQLQQVLQHTGEDHPDHLHLQASLGKLQDFVERFNQDITHTTQTVALDLQHLQTQGHEFRSSASNSSCEMLPLTTSTMDSGIQSTGEDAFLHSGHAHHDGYRWHTDPRQQVIRLHPGLQQAQAKQRQGRHSQEWRLSAHSQPDLTQCAFMVHAGMADPNSATVPHFKPPLAPSSSGDRSARNRRFKIKKRVESQGVYSTTNSSHLRPASAVDFAGARIGLEDWEQQHRALRPHSVLGPFPGDSRPRVIQVYGRNKPQAVQHLTYPAQPPAVVNGHWDPAAGGDQDMDHAGGQYYRHMVDYEDEEDDTRALSDTPSTSSQKASSSRHSHDLPGESDNSDDFNHDDLAAALSHHLKNGVGREGGGGGHLPHYTVNVRELQISQQQQKYSSPRSVPQKDNDDVDKDQVDVHQDFTASDLTPSLLQTQKSPESMSEELKLDLTCFQDDNDIKPASQLKRHSQPVPDTPKAVEAQAPLSMKPLCGAVSASQDVDTVTQLADWSQTEPSREVLSRLSGDKTITSLPPVHPQDSGQPTVVNTNGRMVHPELERPPVRRSVTPSEFSSMARPPMLRRAATPSEYLGGTPDLVSSKGGRRRKDLKNSSNEALHRSVDDVSLSASKKKPFRTSLKNLFQRKKHTESDV